MVCPTLSSSHGPGDCHVTCILPPDNDIVYEMPLFRPRMHPRSFMFVGQSEEGVGDRELVPSAKSQEQQPVAVHLADLGCLGCSWRDSTSSGGACHALFRAAQLLSVPSFYVWLPEAVCIRSGHTPGNAFGRAAVPGEGSRRVLNHR